MEKQKVIVIAGPTASGKTALSIALAKALDGEIISADSMQVYRRMDIGTAKVTPEEADGVPHHLIDIIDPEEEWNVMLFQQKAKEAIQDIASRGKLPILCGGTGFYLRALLYDAQFDEEEGQPELRKQLEREMKELGSEIMHARLREVDPVSAEKIHHHNEKRVIRALEYYMLHQEPISQYNEEQKQKESPYDLCFLALTMDREKLYQRIDLRVDQMVAQGLVEEVKHLLDDGVSPELVSMQGLGYKEIVPYLRGECTLEEAVYILKRDTRHFAKRQLTWFRAQPEVHWLTWEEAGFDASVLVGNALKICAN